MTRARSPRAFAGRLVAAVASSVAALAIMAWPGAGVSRAAAAEPATIRVEQARADASLPGSSVSAIYLTIRNDGAQPDRLKAVRTPAATMAHLHTSNQVNGVNRMRPTEGLEIPAHGSVTLRNGGDHIMLMGLPRPLVAGGTLTVQLTFEHAGDVKVVVPVTAVTGN